MFVLVLITGIAIGVFAILSSIDTGAENVKLPIYNVKRTDNKISITFDCAWGNSSTDKLISNTDGRRCEGYILCYGRICG